MTTYSRCISTLLGVLTIALLSACGDEGTGRSTNIDKSSAAKILPDPGQYLRNPAQGTDEANVIQGTLHCRFPPGSSQG